MSYIACFHLLMISEATSSAGYMGPLTLILAPSSNIWCSQICFSESPSHKSNIKKSCFVHLHLPYIMLPLYGTQFGKQ